MAVISETKRFNRERCYSNASKCRSVHELDFACSRIFFGIFILDDRCKASYLPGNLIERIATRFAVGGFGCEPRPRRETKHYKRKGCN